MQIIPVILSGGQGMRLWPLSRRDKPKQFLDLGNLSSGNSLFEQALLRCRRRIFDDRPIIVGARDHRFLIGQALATTGGQADVVLEPIVKDTCAAVAAACLQACMRSRDALVMVMAADHDIENAPAFAQAAEDAVCSANEGKIVTFGIEPEGPNPHYGYLAPGDRKGNCFTISNFVEKPTRPQAAALLKKGYLWNSGNFLFRAETVLEQIRQHQPEIMEAVEAAFLQRFIDHDFIWLDEESFGSCPSLSFDHGVLEKTSSAVMMPVSYHWTDVGNWEGIANLAVTDECGNAVFGDFINRDSSNNVVHSEGKFTALLGIENLIVVSTRDAVLVADRGRSEEIKHLVGDLVQHDHRVLESTRITRPWGVFEQLDLGDGFQVKRLNVNPGAQLSLQKHARRAEHWIVVSGNAEVTIDDEKTVFGTDENIYIPKGATHRLSNAGSAPLIVIEVQTGDYFGEDDLVRLEDQYDRCVASPSIVSDESDLDPVTSGQGQAFS